MNNFLDNIPTLPLAPWVESAMDWLTSNFSAFFNSIQQFGKLLMNQVTDLLISIPAIILILLVVIFAFFVSGKKLGLAAFSLIGLLFIYNQGLWTHLMETTTLVIFSSIISIIIGIPLGILMSKSTVAENIIKPILDFMQTMPGFVYLIPAVAFFGIGIVPGVFASVIFALPPTVRMTNLGIRQVPKELVEAADSMVVQLAKNYLK